MCYKCGKEWKEIPSEYPCGPCPDKWKCLVCNEDVSPCCGAEIIYETCVDECEVCDYCGNAKCSKCGNHCHCGGCI
jgi:hypothetical protein